MGDCQKQEERPVPKAKGTARKKTAAKPGQAHRKFQLKSLVQGFSDNHLQLCENAVVGRA